jgi:hypothetical protein
MIKLNILNGSDQLLGGPALPVGYDEFGWFFGLVKVGARLRLLDWLAVSGCYEHAAGLWVLPIDQIDVLLAREQSQSKFKILSIDCVAHLSHICRVDGDCGGGLRGILFLLLLLGES